MATLFSSAVYDNASALRNDLRSLHAKDDLCVSRCDDNFHLRQKQRENTDQSAFHCKLSKPRFCCAENQQSVSGRHEYHTYAHSSRTHQ